MSGTIPKGGTLVVSDASFGIIRDYEQIGGYAAVADEATIGAIAVGRLVANGTWRKSLASGTVYLYTSSTPSGGFANGTWTPVSTSTSAGTFSPGAATVATANITLSGEQTLNGITTNASRVLVVGQTSSAQNGIYTSGPGPWTRTSDANTAGAFVLGKSISVVSGAQAGAIYVVTQAPTILGTDPIQFTVNSQGAVVNWGSPGALGSVTPNSVTATTIAFASGDPPSFGENVLSSGGDADYKLTASEYNAGHITFHGTLTADRKRGVPIIPGAFWEFENNTSGGHNIIVMVADVSGYYGNGIVIPPGKIVRGAVSTDNTDIYTVGGGGSNSVDSTLHTTNFTATAGNDYKVDTAAGAVTMTLPSAPTEGDVVGVLDANSSGSFGTHSCTIAAAGAGITVQDWGSLATGATTALNRNGQSLRLKYIGGTSKFWSLIG